MAFQFCERMIHDYRTQGGIVFRQILPPSLLRDLRRATSRAQELARGARNSVQAQRLQPISGYDLDPKPFQDFFDLPQLNDALFKVLSPRHKLGQGGRTGLLLQPGELPWCTNWHRDLRENSPGIPDIEEFRRINRDPLMFNQVNCPLYEDHCTWYVPGSHLRDDLTGEAESAAAMPVFGDNDSYEERERRSLEYCQAMPGAQRLQLDAGDFALYHPNGWHLGNYLPYRIRVTIHDWVPSPELADWYRRWHEGQARVAAQRAAAAPPAPAAT